MPEKTIIFDHQISNKYIKNLLPLLEGTIKSYGIDPKIVEPYFSAPLSGITTLLEHIKNKYKTAENYLMNKCDVKPAEIENVKEKLLEN